VKQNETNESSIEAARITLAGARNELQNVTNIMVGLKALADNATNLYDDETADAVKEALEHAAYDLEISALEYRNAIHEVMDAYADDAQTVEEDEDDADEIEDGSESVQ
jgi:hypothetical protein